MGEDEKLSIQITADTSDFQSEIKQAEQALDSMANTAETVTAVAATTGAAVVGLGSDAEAAASAISMTADSLSDVDVTAGSAAASINIVDDAASSLSAGASAAANSVSDAGKELSDLSGDSNKAADGLNSTAISADDLNDSAQNIINSADNLASILDMVGLSASDLADSLDAVSDKIDKVNLSARSNSLSDFGINLKGIAKVASSVGIAKLVSDCENLYKTQETAELNLETIMRQRQKATDAEINSVKELTSAQQQLGIIGDEVQLAGAQQLATFTRQTSTIKTLIPAMNNLLAQQKGYKASSADAVSIGNLFGKVMNGQTSALTRMGITFSEAQENIMKYGTESERAAVLAQVVTDNVGNMNEAMRNTASGELAATMNELGDAMEEVGGTLQPLIYSVIPIIRNVIKEVAPGIKTISTGISTVGSALAALDSPLVRTIAYVGTAVVVVNKLNMAVGTTATGLILLGTLLSWIIGRFTESQNEAATAIDASAISAVSGAEKGINDTGVAADKTSKSTDKLADSMSNLKKSASGLAAFDEINKISGSGDSLASAIATDDDLERIKDFVDLTTNIPSVEIPELEIPGLDVSKLDWGKLKNGVDEVWGDIKKLFSGNETEIYQGLKGLTDKIEILFGPEFTEFWEGVGSDIYTAFCTSGAESDAALLRLNNRARDIFGEDWTNFWMAVGGYIFSSISGNSDDADRALVDLNNKTRKLFGEEWTDFWMGVGGTIESIIHDHIVVPFGGIIVGVQKLLDGDIKGASADFLRSMSLSVPAQLFASEEQREAIVARAEEIDEGVESSAHLSSSYSRHGGAGSSRDNYNYSTDSAASTYNPESFTESSSFTNYNSFDDYYNFKHSSGGTSLVSPTITTDDVFDAIRAAMDGQQESRTEPIEITTTVELDGDVIGESVSRYNARQLRITND